MRKTTLFLLFILVGILLRLWHLEIPLLEFNPSRQIQTAEITRNLYREGFNILTPTVRYLGPGQNLFLVEFPLYDSIVAILYHIFGIHEYLGRVFSILGWILSSFFLFKISDKYVGGFAANVALFFYTFSPLGVLVSRSFQPDQWMLALSLAAIYFLDKWLTFKKWYLFYLSTFCAACSLLLKIPSILFTLIPAAYLIKSKQTQWPLKIIVFSCFAAIPSIVWYLYASIVSRAGEVLTTSSEISNWFGINIFWNPKYWANMFGFENNLVLLPVGLILFLLGLASKLKRNQYLLYFWLGSLILYFLIFNKHNMTHEYYHLPFVPIAAIFIGIAVARIHQRFDNLILTKNLVFFTLGLFVFASLLVVTWTRAYKPIDRFSYVVEVANLVKKLTDQNDLVIGLMDEGPSLVYYSDRTGWGFDVDPKKIEAHRKFVGFKGSTVPDPIDKLEELRSKGAVLFAASFKPQLLKNKEFSAYIYSKYPVLAETENYVIFDLKSK